MMERDRKLGEELRAALTRPDNALFVRRVLARLDARPWWEVLGTWMRPGLAAALLLATVAGFWMGARMGVDAQVAVEDLPAPGPAGSVTALLNAASPPDVDVVLAVVNGQD